MNEQIKKYIDPIKNFWGKLTKKVKIIIFSVLGGLIVLSLVLGIVMNQTKYVVLYPKLSNSEAIEIMNVLRESGIDYKESGGTISVPSDKENSLRMQLANQGYPKSTTNYDFFTKNVSIMTTDAERKTIEQYQLNQRLEAVIKTLDPISDANVTITVPDTNNFAWDDNKAVATASVAVSLNSGKTLSTANVAGIKQLVAKSVPNMTADNVAVIDKSTGNELNSTASATSTQVDISQFKLEIQKQYENDMKKKILSLLQPVYGAAHVNATVTCNMDLDKKIADSITYTPSKDNRGVINKENTQKGQTTSSSNNAGGVAGATPNTGGTTSTASTASGTTGSTTTTYPGITVNGNTIYSTDSASYEYLVSQMKQQVQGDAASVKDLSVAVVIDNAAMTDQQKAQISSMVANAASIQASKVSVFNSKFFTESSMAQKTNSSDLFAGIDTKILAIGGGVLGLILLLIIVFIIAANKKKQRMRRMIADLNAEKPSANENENDNEEESDEVEAPFEEVSTENIGENFGTGDKKAPIVIDDIQSRRDSLDSKDEALKKELHDFSSQNPEIAAQLIRTWLRGEDDKHG